jgi:site-specific recombinase XerD
MHPSADAVQTALLEFQRRLTSKEEEQFKNASLTDVQETIAQIQDDQDNTKSLRNMARIRSFLEAMEQFGETAEVFLNVSNLVAFIYGPIKFLLLVGQKSARGTRH